MHLISCIQGSKITVILPWLRKMHFSVIIQEIYITLYNCRSVNRIVTILRLNFQQY